MRLDEHSDELRHDENSDVLEVTSIVIGVE